MSSSCLVLNSDLIVAAAAMRPAGHLESPRQAAQELMNSAWQAMNKALQDSDAEFEREDGKYTCASKPQVDASAAQSYWQRQKISPLERDEFDAVASEALTELLSAALVNDTKGYSQVALTVETHLRVGRQGDIDYKLFVDFKLQWPQPAE